jgi:hypothetical protein
MSDEYRQTRRDGRMRLARAMSILLALMVCLLLVQAAAAHADVMQKHRSAYKSKLTYYSRQMDVEFDFWSASRTATESHKDIIQTALADPELQKQIPQLEETALTERSLLQGAMGASRTKMLANIAAFKAKALDWFKTKADKNRFKAGVAVMRGGFVTIYSADEDLLNALYALGTSADVATATQSIQLSVMDQGTADDLFEKGMKQLRALQ